MRTTHDHDNHHHPGASHATVAWLLLQVGLVGVTLGLTRTVLPAMAEADFGVPRTSFVLLTTFVLAFGVVKGIMNWVAGRWSDRVGRRRVLLTGWVAALPVPLMLWHAPHWGWVVAATVLLGVNQGLAWSMTQTAQLDITPPHARGLQLGLNECAGYAGVALAGWGTAYVAQALGTRNGLLASGLAVVALGLLLAAFTVPETRPADLAGPPRGAGAPGAWALFIHTSWTDRRLAVLCQAGAVEKCVDALVWVFYPLFLTQRGLTLPQAAAVIGVYGLTWGLGQLAAGRLSDHWGRHRLNVGGMVLCGAGVALMLVGRGTAWWALSAGISGMGMAMLYPNLAAAVADLAEPAWRGTAIGTYRFWRDLGYAMGALGLGLSAQVSGRIEAAFVFVAGAMWASAALLWWWGEETHPAHRAVPHGAKPGPEHPSSSTFQGSNPCHR
jgi:MFS family permease